MINIKLIALDMDGTACRFHQGIEPDNIMTIIKAQEMGGCKLFLQREDRF